MKVRQYRSGFTLLELLVVVSAVALLAAMFLPSLVRARAETRMVQCQANIRQLEMAFLAYTAVFRGRLPGMSHDRGADWLGLYNTTPPCAGRQPEDGTLFRSYMGANKPAYLCPDDDLQPNYTNVPRSFSYTAHHLLSGARVESVSAAHYRQSGDPEDLMNYSETDHTQNMRPMGGVPMILEEHAVWGLSRWVEGGWSESDGVTDRHLRTSGRGWGNIGFTDGHAGRVHFPSARGAVRIRPYFHANSLCIRTAGARWVAGASWTMTRPYGHIERVAPAEAVGVQH